MRSIAFLTLAAFIGISTCSSSTVVCTKINRNATCFIEGLSLHSSSEYSEIIFPNTSQVIMQSCEILSFTSQLFDALPNAAFLTLKGGLIPSVTFRSESLHSLRIDNTELREFAVVPVENRNLNTLIINGNPLNTLPPAISLLTALSILDLSNNKLESVNLNWFRSMENLLALDLSSNHLVRLDTSSTLRLARVKNFWINHNRLREVAFFPSFMPALQRVRLVENFWSCPWVREARQAIWIGSIEVYGAEYSCPTSTFEGGLCCYEADHPDVRGTRYEIVSVTVDRQDSSHGEVSAELLPSPDKLRARDGNADRTEMAQLRRSYEELGEKYRRVVEEKELLEKRFVNTVRELEATVRRLTAELGEAQNAISLNRV